MILAEDRPVFPIGVVAEMLEVHPETLRVWERNGIIRPARRGRRRLYSDLDLRRLNFVRSLIEEQGLNLAGVRRILELYPCWQMRQCAGGRPPGSASVNPAKPCWKMLGTYCFKPEDRADICSGCRLYRRGRKCSGRVRKV
ncbi:MAG: MerR family transcriptional regulator [Actinomycetota bacterium]|nr:MerR family transcriptional regulator [Actinomycetota bacterium]